MMDAQTRNELAGRFGAIASQAGKLVMAIAVSNDAEAAQNYARAAWRSR